MAYCLLGIFEINMPLLYGEGGRAFIRLQEEIIRHNNDQTIFCWSIPPFYTSHKPRWKGCLAPHARAFRDSANYSPLQSTSEELRTDFQLTNSGLRITLPLINCMLKGFKFALLEVSNPTKQGHQVCLCLERIDRGFYARSTFQSENIALPRQWTRSVTSIYPNHDRNPDGFNSTVDEFKVRPLLNP